MGLIHKSDFAPSRPGRGNVPNYALVLLLADVGRHFAVDLAGAQRHSQGLCHVLLYRWRDVGVLVCRPNPQLRRAFVLELARAQLGEVGAADEGEDDIGRKPLLYRGLEAKGVRCIDDDACVLGGNDGIDHGCQVVDVGERFYAKDNVVEWAFLTSGRLLWCPHDCIEPRLASDALLLCCVGRRCMTRK